MVVPMELFSSEGEIGIYASILVHPVLPARFAGLLARRHRSMSGPGPLTMFRL